MSRWNRRWFTWRRVLLSLLALIAASLLLGVVFWLGSTREPTGTALEALRSDDVVRVVEQAEMIVFEPAAGGSRTGFVFYPGAGVDFRSYAPVLGRIATHGYTVVLVEVPLNLAFFRANAADEAIAQYPAIERWVVGGHSLGGVVAAYYAASHPFTAGLVLWASYPAGDALAGAEFPVLSIYGSEDGLTTVEDIELSRSRLPAGTEFVEIKGGNHAQFGSYGAQPGDSTASVPAEEQWEQIVRATVIFLEGAFE